SYLDYAMSVIVGRALPGVQDGLKPVHRRILWSMLEAGLRPDRPHRKSANVVGQVSEKYHPRDDQAIYDAPARRAQPWSLRAPLIDGHGNFGSPEGDPPAAMRYTEARLSAIAMELLRDMDAETVDFIPNYDGYEQEPVVLPSRFPNLLVNGAGGIAVGMATNIPPHNLGEVIDATIAQIDDPNITIASLMKHVKGPDFPTGPAIVCLQETFGVTMLSIVDGVPLVLNLKEMLGHYIDHQVDVVTRRTRYQLRKAEERDHIVQGLLIALDNLDAVIKIIRGSQDSEEARTKLMQRFKLSEIQANHILDMPLRRLTRLAREELEQEHKDLVARIKYLNSLLKDSKKILAVIKEELTEIRTKFADPRRSQIKA